MCGSATEEAMKMKLMQGWVLAAACGGLMLTGCSISKEGSGGDKRVSIEAPGASVHVDTGSTANDTGIPLYPGAQELQNTEKDKNRAHVDLKMPFLKVRVVALKFTSNDAPDKVAAFYRNKLGNYGQVLECKGSGQDVELESGRGLDSPVKCDKVHGDSAETSLKVGTEGNQHVVSVKPNGKGTEFSLVYVHLNNGKSDDDYGGKPPS
jgi:hypothetical protein